MFLAVVAILSIVLAFAQPVYRWVTPPGLVVAAVAGATLLPALLAGTVGAYALRLLERYPHEPRRGQVPMGWANHLVPPVLTACHAFVLLCTDWTVLVRSTPVVGIWPVLPGLLSIIPFLIAVVLVWVVSYPAERAVRQIAVETFIFRQRPVRPVWTLGQYLVNNLRHQVLFILIPMLLILAARDVIMRYDRELRELSGHPFLADVLLGGTAILVALIAPEILRHVWSTRRLPDGPLRDRLQAVCRRLKLRYREILVWQAGGMIVNAAVMGVLAPLRYVLITDAMLEQLDDTKIEAVFGHEAGHVKQHHILFFLLFALISGAAVTIFSVRTRHLDPEGIEFQLIAAVVGAVLLLKWVVVFTWISRRFERQADIYGVRVLALGGLPCSGPCVLHGTPTSNPGPLPPRGALCSSAALLFGNTLNDVAVLNGIAPDARSWRHGSISGRSRTLIRLAHDPRAAARSERQVLCVKWAIVLVAVGMCAWACWEISIWKLLNLAALF